MFKIEAIIRPFKLEEVQNSLVKIGIENFTVTAVKGRGSNPNYNHEIYSRSALTVDFLPKVKIELIVDNELIKDKAVAIILVTAKTGKVNDGKVFVSPCESMTHIRTGETKKHPRINSPASLTEVAQR